MGNDDRVNMCTDGGCGCCVHCVEFDADCTYDQAKEIMRREKAGMSYEDAKKEVKGRAMKVYAGQSVNVGDWMEYAEQISPGKWKVNFEIMPNPDRKAAVEATKKKRESDA